MSRLRLRGVPGRSPSGCAHDAVGHENLIRVQAAHRLVESYRACHQKAGVHAIESVSQRSRRVIVRLQHEATHFGLIRLSSRFQRIQPPVLIRVWPGVNVQVEGAFQNLFNCIIHKLA